MLYITKRATFSASHKLWSTYFSDKENMEIYGQCANPNGHGHNYVLEVTVAGQPDPKTGMIMNFDILKQIMRKEIVEHVDHRYLNVDVSWLSNVIPTAEELVRIFWKRLEGKLPQGKLYRIRLSETENNFTEYYGEKHGQ